jgi:NTE family protein
VGGRPPPKLGLVLSGGGAPAAYFGAGVAAAVQEAGLRPTVFSGVSAGALNACALGVGLEAAALIDLWTQVRWQDIYRPRLDLWRMLDPRPFLRRPTTNLVQAALETVRWTWLLDSEPARRTLSAFLGGSELRIKDGMTVVVSAVDQGTAEVVRFTNRLPGPGHHLDEFREVALGVDHLMASSAAPLLFPPGRFGEHEFVDAGLVANTPLKPALAYEPDAVIVVSASGIARPAPTPCSLGEAIGLLSDNVTTFALLSDYRHAETVNKLVAAEEPGATEYKHIDLLLIEPTGLSFNASAFLRFSPGNARRIIEHGRSVGRRALAEWPVLDRLTAHR